MRKENSWKLKNFFRHEILIKLRFSFKVHISQILIAAFLNFLLQININLIFHVVQETGKRRKEDFLLSSSAILYRSDAED